MATLKAIVKSKRKDGMYVGTYVLPTIVKFLI